MTIVTGSSEVFPSSHTKGTVYHLESPKRTESHYTAVVQLCQTTLCVTLACIISSVFFLFSNQPREFIIVVLLNMGGPLTAIEHLLHNNILCLLDIITKLNSQDMILNIITFTPIVDNPRICSYMARHIGSFTNSLRHMCHCMYRFLCDTEYLRHKYRIKGVIVFYVFVKIFNTIMSS